MEGYPIQIIAASDEHAFEMKNENKLRSILLDDDIKDRKVVVVSVAGAFRKGKSFLLNFFLRYLHYKYNAGTYQDEWMGAETECLEGFSWTGGPYRHTVGIVMWSHIFKTTVNGQKLAIVLLDTQGMFDSRTTIMECVTMFAMSTMLSSIQVYNLSQAIQENDLQHLQLFTEYGRLALADNTNIPFQNLLFLVRDWGHASYGIPYGLKGGGLILRDVMGTDEIDDDDMMSLRRQIKTSFENISCFLLPHPGLNVMDYTFSGCLKDLDDDFKEQLQNLVPMLLAPSKLMTKKIHGKPLTALGLFDLFKTYIKIFNRENLPTPKSMFKATAEANNNAAIKSCQYFYICEMKSFVEKELFTLKQLLDIAVQVAFGNTYEPLDNTKLLTKHDEVQAAALEMFDKQPKMGGQEFSVPYRHYLVLETEKIFETINKFNEGKCYFERFIQMINLLIALLKSVLFKDPPSFVDLFTDI